MSPDSPEPDDNYSLTPRTEAKYNKIDEEFQVMMQRNQQLVASGRVRFFDVNIRFQFCN
jgi:MADS-box transcription enhancer factor 2A